MDEIEIVQGVILVNNVIVSMSQQHEDENEEPVIRQQLLIVQPAHGPPSPPRPTDEETKTDNNKKATHEVYIWIKPANAKSFESEVWSDVTIDITGQTRSLKRACLLELTSWCHEAQHDEMAWLSLPNVMSEIGIVQEGGQEDSDILRIPQQRHASDLDPEWGELMVVPSTLEPEEELAIQEQKQQKLQERQQCLGLRTSPFQDRASSFPHKSTICCFSN